MRILSILLVVAALAIQASWLGAAEINPDEPTDPLNKIFFGVRTHPASGARPHSMQIEVDTVKECFENAAKMLAKDVAAGDKATEVRCIKERNADAPS